MTEKPGTGDAHPASPVSKQVLDGVVDPAACFKGRTFEQPAGGVAMAVNGSRIVIIGGSGIGPIGASVVVTSQWQVNADPDALSSFFDTVRAPARRGHLGLFDSLPVARARG